MPFFLILRNTPPATKQDPRAFHFYLESVEMLSVFVFAAKRRVKGAATLTSFALGFVEIHAEFITAAAR